MFAELVELGKRIRKGHDALKEEKCSWDIVIDQDGNFIQLIPCDITVEAEMLTAKQGKARLLLDKPQETLGFEGSKDKHKAEDKHKKYLAKLEEYKEVQELFPIFSFYNKPKEVEKAIKAFSNLPPAKQNSNMTFMVNSTRLVSLECVKDAIKKKYEDTLCSKKQGNLCAVCGTNTYPILDEPHGPVKLPKGQTAGSMLVSYNTNAFESYNLKGNLNSGICTNCARNYIEALRYLVGNGHEIIVEKGKKGEKKFKFSNRQNISDDTIALFWTKEQDNDIDPFSDILQPTEERVKKALLINSDRRVSKHRYRNGELFLLLYHILCCCTYCCKGLDSDKCYSVSKEPEAMVR